MGRDEGKRKLILKHGLDIGDVLMMTIAVRDLHIAHPNRYLTDVRTRWPDLWLNNPHVTGIDNDDPDATLLEIGYPLIQNPGSLHFSDAFRMDLAEKLGIQIPWVSMSPDLHLSDMEKNDNVVARLTGYRGKHWLLNAGYKADVILKHYPFWQEVVDLLKNSVQIVQMGAANDHHEKLENVISLVGKTSLRELIKMTYWAEGTIGPISVQMVLAAAYDKPAVVINGGKEPPRWQMYNNHRFLSVCGCLPCAPGNGCWKAKWEDCVSRVGNVPRCFAMIPPDEVARNVLLYYEGGMLKF